jgi:hypothetical protein
VLVCSHIAVAGVTAGCGRKSRWCVAPGFVSAADEAAQCLPTIAVPAPWSSRGYGVPFWCRFLLEESPMGFMKEVFTICHELDCSFEERTRPGRLAGRTLFNRAENVIYSIPGGQGCRVLSSLTHGSSPRHVCRAIPAESGLPSAGPPPAAP